MEEFSTWKEDEEAHNHTFYILHDKPYIMPRTNAEGTYDQWVYVIHITSFISYVDDAVERYYYVCCRDGNYKECKREHKTDKKWPHQKLSRKLNDVCISRIYVTKFKSGKVEVKYVSAHSNHTTGPTEDAFLPLPATTKEEIAMKLSVGISIERIMDGMKIFVLGLCNNLDKLIIEIKH